MTTILAPTLHTYKSLCALFAETPNNSKPYRQRQFTRWGQTVKLTPVGRKWKVEELPPSALPPTPLPDTLFQPRDKATPACAVALCEYLLSTYGYVGIDHGNGTQTSYHDCWDLAENIPLVGEDFYRIRGEVKQALRLGKPLPITAYPPKQVGFFFEASAGEVGRLVDSCLSRLNKRRVLVVTRCYKIQAPHGRAVYTAQEETAKIDAIRASVLQGVPSFRFVGEGKKEAVSSWEAELKAGGFLGKVSSAYCLTYSRETLNWFLSCELQAGRINDELVRICKEVVSRRLIRLAERDCKEREYLERYATDFRVVLQTMCEVLAELWVRDSAEEAEALTEETPNLPTSHP